MAYTERFVATDATVGPFAIGFNYQDANAMKVTLMELDESNPIDVAFTFAGTPSEGQPAGTTVVLSAAYPVGKQLRIYKNVDLDTPRVQWESSSTFNDTALNDMTVNLMEMAQTAYDAAERSRSIAVSTAQTLAGIEDSLTQQAADAIAAAQAAQALAEYWAQVALDAGSTANPEEAAAIARDAAIAARDAAIAAKVAAEAARDAAQGFANTASTHKDTALTYANNSASSAASAANSVVQAQAIIDSGSLRWSGSLKFVSTSNPNPAQGANGDFWFKREA